jgi:hypothetical protein
MDYYKNKFLEEAKKDGVENPSKFLYDVAVNFILKSNDLHHIVESHIIYEYGLEGIKADLDFYGIDKNKYWKKERGIK